MHTALTRFLSIIFCSGLCLCVCSCCLFDPESALFLFLPPTRWQGLAVVWVLLLLCWWPSCFTFRSLFTSTRTFRALPSQVAHCNPVSLSLCCCPADKSKICKLICIQVTQSWWDTQDILRLIGSIIILHRKLVSSALTCSYGLSASAETARKFFEGFFHQNSLGGLHFLPHLLVSSCLIFVLISSLMIPPLDTFHLLFKLLKPRRLMPNFSCSFVSMNPLLSFDGAHHFLIFVAPPSLVNPKGSWLPSRRPSLRQSSRMPSSSSSSVSASSVASLAAGEGSTNAFATISRLAGTAWARGWPWLLQWGG